MNDNLTDRQALEAYLDRVRRRLPETAQTLGSIAGQATALDDTIDPGHFRSEFSHLIRSLQALGTTMDNATRRLGDTEAVASDESGLVTVRCSARLEDVAVSLGPGAATATPKELERAIASAFTNAIARCRDLTLHEVESSSARVRHHTGRAN
ncbi:hypothetical protein LLS1_24280 [Leifsonia sp. LS1]|uniref:YbaB/EbfC family nucleoid-associated protein n=1 Tax=Leifsonia sp. LS1 TaxID=2828483 RepID=UPI001CFF2DC5|nr:YbaB/EbfC family nucleoid-associated protein [Leifsonia sp. LS1]GIT80759.1 hypothetical protein LLS1_24280 [Leifsonia sp. LS1]